jgi:cell division protein ZapA
MAEKSNQLQVEIFGQTYSVQAGADPGYIESVASYVDHQMRDVSRASGAVDSVRIAVLAALNIADELFRARSAGREGGDRLEERTKHLVALLSQALQE